MKRFFLTAILGLTANLGWAQHDHDHGGETPGALIEDMTRAIASQSGDKVHHSFVGVVPRVGLAMQKGVFLEAGVSLDFYDFGYVAGSEYVSFTYSNLRPYVAGDIMMSNRLLGGVKTGVEYIISTPVIGMAFGGEVGYYGNSRARSMIVTPRLMFSFVKMELTYGYNFFRHSELRRDMGPHRLGVTMTVNPRFWRRKKAIYNDYYESYTR